MMNQLRRGAGGFTAKLLLGLLVLSFVVWGIADGFNSVSSPNTVIVAGDTEVTAQEFQQAYGQAVNRISAQLQRRPTPEEQSALNIDQSVLSQLTTVALLDEEARRLGLSLSDTGLAQRIANEPAFRDSSGRYSAATAREVLRRANLTEEQYAAEQRKMSRRTQIMDATTGGMAMPAAFADALGQYNGERRSIAYVTFSPAAADAIADPDQETLSNYYDDTSEDYATPELRSFSFVPIVPEKMFDPASITDAEITAEYENNLAEFTTPEQRNIQQIVFADKAAADAARESIAGGATFEQIAEQAGRSAADYNLGLRTADQIPDTTIRDAVFALQQGEVSAVVEGLFGPVILRVTEIKPEQVRGIDEVRDEIRQQLAAVRANELATNAYNAVQEAITSGAPLAEAAETAGVELVTINGMDQKGRNAEGVEFENLVGGSDLISALFLAQPGIAAEPVNFAPGSYVFFDLTDIQEAHERPLEEIRAQLIADWKSDEADRQLEERLNALADRVSDGETLEAIAAEAGATIQTAPAITRSSGQGDIGPQATIAAFAGPNGHVAVAPSNNTGDWMLLQVTEVSDPANPKDNVQPEMLEQLDELAGNDLLQGFIARLQRDIPVSYNQQTLQSVRGVLQ